jgi:uncharacterized protein DUF5715
MRKCMVFVLWLLLCCSAQAKRKHSASYDTLLPPSRESLLRQNQMINQMGLERIKDEHRLSELVKDGTLVALPNNDAAGIAPSLPSNRRYVLPMTRDFIEKLASEYYAEFHLPLQVDSAVRSRAVQRKLRRYNPCAAPVDGDTASSHEAGTTVDLSRRMSKQQTKWMEWRLFYYQEARKLILVEEEKHCYHVFVMGEANDAYNAGTTILE